MNKKVVGKTKHNWNWKEVQGYKDEVALDSTFKPALSPELVEPRAIVIQFKYTSTSAFGNDH